MRVRAISITQTTSEDTPLNRPRDKHFAGDATIFRGAVLGCDSTLNRESCPRGSGEAEGFVVVLCPERFVILDHMVRLVPFKLMLTTAFNLMRDKMKVTYQNNRRLSRI
jgi:hypothetical protein